MLDERGSTWARHTVDVGQDPAEVAFVLNPRTVAGRVRIGESGVPAAELPAFRAGLLPADRCTSGLLAPFGELELDTREDRPGASGGPV